MDTEAWRAATHGVAKESDNDLATAQQWQAFETTSTVSGWRERSGGPLRSSCQLFSMTSCGYPEIGQGRSIGRGYESGLVPLESQLLRHPSTPPFPPNPHPTSRVLQSSPLRAPETHPRLPSPGFQPGFPSPFASLAPGHCSAPPVSSACGVPSGIKLTVLPTALEPSMAPTCPQDKSELLSQALEVLRAGHRQLCPPHCSRPDSARWALPRRTPPKLQSGTPDPSHHPGSPIRAVLAADDQLFGWCVGDPGGTQGTPACACTQPAVSDLTHVLCFTQLGLARI